MMIDSSVLIAILENQPEAARLIEAIADDLVHDFSETDIPCCIDWTSNKR